jgi:DNA-binding response OmpR family regulator
MSQGRLLVLDDDETVGMLLVFVAQRAGFEARLCERPQDFFEALATWAPSHLAIDLHMPQMSGLDVLRRLAASHCPSWVIISTGAGGAEVETALRTAQELGLRTAGALPKPFTLAGVRALLMPTGPAEEGPAS